MRSHLLFDRPLPCSRTIPFVEVDTSPDGPVVVVVATVAGTVAIASLSSNNSERRFVVSVAL